MNPISKRETTVCSKIAQRLFNLLRLESPASGAYEGESVLTVLLDLEFVNDVCRLDFDKLLAFDDGDFLHDMRGIYKHFNRATKELEDGFTPRASKVVAQPIGATSGEAFDKSRATNLYLMAARDLGTDLGGFSLVDLLADKTDWDLDKCRAMSGFILDDDSVKRLLVEEGIPKFIDPVRECDPSDFTGDGCRNTVSTRHSCPYDVEVKGIDEASCDCCEICEQKCRRNI